MSSFKPEVIADSTGVWAGNSLRFKTREEAEANVHDLMMRWTSVRETRVVESDDPVTHHYADGKLTLSVLCPDCMRERDKDRALLEPDAFRRRWPDDDGERAPAKPEEPA